MVNLCMLLIMMKFEDHKIVARAARQGESLVTLDGENGI
ncbi:phenylalanyl-tRNA synthetase beta chain domain protein [Streptococcus pyogenes MGAS2111]|nr:phenylalanyl-tRNA synthetase beta chain domain protein [Streptococcus pyogenes MGAS2111]